MLQRIIISLTMLMGLVAPGVLAQNTAQAVMRVSARVVSGVSVDGTDMAKVTVIPDGITELGKLTINGLKSGEAFIDVSNKIVMEGDDGDLVEFDINSNINSNSDKKTDVILEGVPADKMRSKKYRGKLLTTIEYF